MTAPDLAAFLLEQYDEAEHMAKQDAWAVTPEGTFPDTPDGRLLKGMSGLIRRRSDETLLDIAAKRRIVEWACQPRECYECDCEFHGEDVMRMLAQPLADDPDFRQEWAL